jgi:hypothetical protein
MGEQGMALCITCRLCASNTAVATTNKIIVEKPFQLGTTEAMAALSNTE